MQKNFTVLLYSGSELIDWAIDWLIGSHINAHTVNLVIYPVLYIHPVVSYPQAVINTVDKSVDKSARVPVDNLWIRWGCG